MAKNESNQEAVRPVQQQAAPAPQQEEFVPKAQYDALLQQAQGLINEANSKIDDLIAKNKLLENTLEVQNRLIKKLLDQENK